MIFFNILLFCFHVLKLYSFQVFSIFKLLFLSTFSYFWTRYFKKKNLCNFFKIFSNIIIIFVPLLLLTFSYFSWHFFYNFKIFIPLNFCNILKHSIRTTKSFFNIFLIAPDIFIFSRYYSFVFMFLKFKLYNFLHLILLHFLYCNFFFLGNSVLLMVTRHCCLGYVKTI